MVPLYRRPTWTVAVTASTIARAWSNLALSPLATVTLPVSSTSITEPVCSWIDRIVLPPGPISAPILSVSIFKLTNRGAVSAMSAFGLEIVCNMILRISIRASRLCVSVAPMISISIPLIFRSN